MWRPSPWQMCMQGTHKHTYICLYICTICTTYCVLCGLFRKLWMKLLGLPVLWNTKTAPIITLASETAGPTFPLRGAEIKLCPRFHPPVGGARGCWKTRRKPEGRHPSCLLSAPGKSTDGMTLQIELGKLCESPVFPTFCDLLIIPSPAPLSALSSSSQHTSWVCRLSVFVNHPKLLVSV